MSRLHVAYDISDLVPDAPMQAVGNADRPLAAFTAAAATWARGGRVMGEWNGLSDDQIADLIDATFAASNVPNPRAQAWVNAINGEKLFDMAGAYPRYTDMELSPYQRDALADCSVSGGVLALAVGLGKTVTAVNGACYAADITAAKSTRCWILAPLNAMGAWAPFLATLRKSFGDVQVLSVDSAHKLDGVSNDGGVLIIDEAHTLGDMTSRRTKAAHRLRPLFDVCFCLTGTLLHAGVEKCLSMLDLATPGMALFSSRWKCGEHFKCLVQKSIGRRTVTALEKPNAKKAEFLEYLSRYCVSLDKDSPNVRDAAQIPGQTLHTVVVGKPWPKLEAKTAELVTEILEAGEPLPHAQAVMHMLARDNIEQKFDEWSHVATTIDGPMPAGFRHPWVFFAHYRDTLDALEARLRVLDESFGGWSYVRVDGDTPVRERQEAERKFQAGEVQFFLGQTTAAGVAINLFRTHLSAGFDHSWKAIDYAQAIGRTCRRGQTKECHHYDFVANPLQVGIVARLRSAADFNAECVEYQNVRRAVAAKGAA